MSDAKDSAIKLFGRTIKLPEIPSKKAESESGLNYSARSTDALLDDGVLRHRSCSPSSLVEGIDLGRDVAKRDSAKGVSDGDGVEVDISTELFDQTGMKGNRKAPSIEDQNESNEPHDKTLKKPDNLLPCPRCNSLDTKFCYYNNYNVSQPRHFCKNCHRYWTAGGTIRNVAVGTGRRKNKNVANTIHPTLKPNHNGLLSNGSMGESIGSVLNIADKSVHDLNSNGFSPVGFSVPLFPAVAPYVVGCSMPGTWTVPWLNSLPASQKYENPNTCLNSQTSGKRSRDDDSLMKHVNTEKYEPLNNPSVLSRSLSFQESSPDKSRRS